MPENMLTFVNEDVELEVLEYCIIGRWQGFSTLALVKFEPHNSFLGVREVLLCIKRCLRAGLASSHEMSVAKYSPTLQFKKYIINA